MKKTTTLYSFRKVLVSCVYFCIRSVEFRYFKNSDWYGCRRGFESNGVFRSLIPFAFLGAELIRGPIKVRSTGKIKYVLIKHILANIFDQFNDLLQVRKCKKVFSHTLKFKENENNRWNLISEPEEDHSIDWKY